MADPRARPGRLSSLLVALVLALGWTAAVAPAPSHAALAPWTGGINLYRTGVFTTQKSWLWCTAANVQIMRNIVHRQADHSRANQERYFRWMRTQNRYDIPVRDGVDVRGWSFGLRRWVDSRYRAVTSSTFSAALRSAVKSLRLSNRPVGLLVARGNHAWILHGFTATADPAVTSNFTVTSVRVTGPLWGLQSRSYGYDMRPNKQLTPRQLRDFWKPWHYAGIRMIWEGRFVAIQVV
jgi:hypothetical protein